MAQKFRLGMKGKLYHGPGGTTGVPAQELSNVKDVTLTLDAAEADVTTRQLRISRNGIRSQGVQHRV